MDIGQIKKMDFLIQLSPLQVILEASRGVATSSYTKQVKL